MHNENQTYLNPPQSQNTNFETVAIDSQKELFLQYWQKIVATEEDNSHYDEQATFLADHLSAVEEVEDENQALDNESTTTALNLWKKKLQKIALVFSLFMVLNQPSIVEANQPITTPKQEQKIENKNEYEQVKKRADSEYGRGRHLHTVLNSDYYQLADEKSANFLNFLNSFNFEQTGGPPDILWLLDHNLDKDNLGLMEAAQLNQIMDEVQAVETDIKDYHLLIRKIIIDSAKENMSSKNDKNGMKLILREANWRALQAYTPEEISFLYEKCGITKFFRYRPQDLKKQVEVLNSNQAEHKGYVFRLFAKRDINRAFDTYMQHLNYGDIDDHSQKYPVIIVEVENYTSFLDKIKLVTKKLGAADIMIIDAHGSRNGFIFSNKNNIRGFSEDNSFHIQRYFKKGTKLEEAIKANGTLVLNSCSTGDEKISIERNEAERASLAIQLSYHLPDRLIIAPGQDAMFGGSKFHHTEKGLKAQFKYFIDYSPASGYTNEVTRHYLNGQRLDPNDNQRIIGDYREHIYRPIS